MLVLHQSRNHFNEWALEVLVGRYFFFYLHRAMLAVCQTFYSSCFLVGNGRVELRKRANDPLAAAIITRRFYNSTVRQTPSVHQLEKQRWQQSVSLICIIQLQQQPINRQSLDGVLSSVLLLLLSDVTRRDEGGDGETRDDLCVCVCGAMPELRPRWHPTSFLGSQLAIAGLIFYNCRAAAH